MKDDKVVEDIELVRIETPQHSSDQVSVGMMIGEISQIQMITAFPLESNWNDQTKNSKSNAFQGKM